MPKVARVLPKGKFVMIGSQVHDGNLKGTKRG
jgi:hypothetical protein